MAERVLVMRSQWRFEDVVGACVRSRRRIAPSVISSSYLYSPEAAILESILN